MAVTASTWRGRYDKPDNRNWASCCCATPPIMQCCSSGTLLIGSGRNVLGALRYDSQEIDPLLKSNNDVIWSCCGDDHVYIRFSRQSYIFPFDRVALFCYRESHYEKIWETENIRSPRYGNLPRFSCCGEYVVIDYPNGDYSIGERIVFHGKTKVYEGPYYQPFTGYGYSCVGNYFWFTVNGIIYLFHKGKRIYEEAGSNEGAQDDGHGNYHYFRIVKSVQGKSNEIILFYHEHIAYEGLEYSSRQLPYSGFQFSSASGVVCINDWENKYGTLIRDGEKIFSGEVYSPIQISWTSPSRTSQWDTVQSKEYEHVIFYNGEYVATHVFPEGSTSRGILNLYEENWNTLLPLACVTSSGAARSTWKLTVYRPDGMKVFDGNIVGASYGTSAGYSSWGDYYSFQVEPWSAGAGQKVLYYLGTQIPITQSARIDWSIAMVKNWGAGFKEYFYLVDGGTTKLFHKGKSIIEYPSSAGSTRIITRGNMLTLTVTNGRYDVLVDGNIIASGSGVENSSGPSTYCNDNAVIIYLSGGRQVIVNENGDTLEGDNVGCCGKNWIWSANADGTGTASYQGKSFDFDSSYALNWGLTDGLKCCGKDNEYLTIRASSTDYILACRGEIVYTGPLTKYECLGKYLYGTISSGNGILLYGNTVAHRGPILKSGVCGDEIFWIVHTQLDDPSSGQQRRFGKVFIRGIEHYDGEISNTENSGSWATWGPRCCNERLIIQDVPDNYMIRDIFDADFGRMTFNFSTFERIDRA